MSDWARDSFFYHIYPLGLCGAPLKNDFQAAPQPRLDKILPWLDHAHDLGANALYLGPLFESSSHGYDTVDYFTVDRRLGTNESLARLCRAARERGFRVVLDAVFNHVGRDFWAFRDVREKGKGSPYCSWFQGLTFAKRSPLGDPFNYDTWNGHYSLVKLDVRVPAVKAHLFAAVTRWCEELGIDGLRLDAADCLDLDFLRALRAHGRGLKPDFWLLGEIVHGDYRRWVAPDLLDSVTNYECYKGLYSSHLDANYFEIAHSLNRQFGPMGIYKEFPLYSFADNHDVDRVASSLFTPDHLAPLYAILFTMPGIPSVYYGSEWGITGRKDGTDRQLRPGLDLATVAREGPQRGLAETITRLARVRAASPALRAGDYTQLHVASRQLVFMRALTDDRVIVAVNADSHPVTLDINAPEIPSGRFVDMLRPADSFDGAGGTIRIAAVPAFGARILRRATNG
jgi:cyclomaltodextrinase / maltogenic alpha-amylase / neopullulanase